MSTPVFTTLMEFLQKLEETDIYYTLAHHHDGAIMVEVAVSGERWEVEYFADGTVSVERFVRDDDVSDESALDMLLTKIADESEDEDTE